MLDRPRRPARWAGLAVLATFVVVLAGCGDNDAERNQNSLEPRGDSAQKILDLFTPFFWIAVVIGVLVVGATVYVAVRFRARPGRDDNPKQLHGSTPLEVGWTIVPALILAVMAVPTVATIFDLAEDPTGDDVVDIRVIGKQWWWEYEYHDGEIADDSEPVFVTANEMHIPVDTPVRLRLESDNVIHSFWVPNLAGKRDLAPGRVHELTISSDTVGVYDGQCAEYCGLSHANMRLRVIVQERADYEAWVAAQQEPLSAAGAEFVTDPEGPIARYGCTACHAFDGVLDANGNEVAAARVGPNLTHLGDRTTFAGAIFELNTENLSKWVRNAPDRKPMSPTKGVGMPAFPAMTDDEVAALVDFLQCETATNPSDNEACG
ncbi:MAG TPA: cytochrome c oxidase subunit II [Acidimicrobiia bacterium]|nr:cytochrome c oxidase subunit II [Acidimicrobiia bacterium]